jgi:hypothetical protein
VPEITAAIIALREAVKAYEAAPKIKDRNEHDYEGPDCRAALELYMTATNQTHKVAASTQVKEQLARLRDVRATAQLHYDIEHAMEHAFGSRTYDQLNEQGDNAMREARRAANIAYEDMRSSLGMGGLGTFSTLGELSRIHCRVCQATERARLQSA